MTKRYISLTAGCLIVLASCADDSDFSGKTQEPKRPPVAASDATPEINNSQAAGEQIAQEDSPPRAEPLRRVTPRPIPPPLPKPAPAPAPVDKCANLQAQMLIPFRSPNVWRYVIFPFTYPQAPTPFASLPARTLAGSAPFGEGYDQVTRWDSATQVNAAGTQIAIEVKFTLPEPTSLRIQFKYDNGSVAYLNGKEIFRNWPAEGISASSVTTRDVCDPGLTVAGENSFLLNVEDHGYISYADAQIEILK